MNRKKSGLIKGFIQEYKPVDEKGSKPKTQQFAEVLRLILYCQFTPAEYFYYRFYEKGKDYRFMLNYISNFYSLEYFHPGLRDPAWDDLIQNKLLFNIYCRHCGLPVPETYCFYDRQCGYALNGTSLNEPVKLKAYLNERQPGSMVIKPVGGRKGQNVMVLDEVCYGDSGIEGCRVGNRWVSFDEIVNQMNSNQRGYRYTGYLIEEKLDQHQILKRLNLDSLNTLRVITFLNKDHRASVQLAALKLGRRGSPVDNRSAGGMNVALDLKTGILGRGIFNTKQKNTWYEEHPDSKVLFKGLQVPCWDEIVDLCCRAAVVLPFFRSIGWDVAVTPGGPVLVEANSYWGVEIQVLTDSGYLQPEIRKELARFGLLFPAEKLPAFSIKRLIKAIGRWRMKR